MIVVIGGCLLFECIEELFREILPEQIMQYLHPIFNDLPKIIISLIILFIGVMLIKGKKKELDEEEMMLIEKKED